MWLDSLNGEKHSAKPIGVGRYKTFYLLSLGMGERTGSIDHAAMRQGNPGVFAVPAGVWQASFGVCVEVPIERQGDFRFRENSTYPIGVYEWDWTDTTNRWGNLQRRDLEDLEKA